MTRRDVSRARTIIYTGLLPAVAGYTVLRFSLHAWPESAGVVRPSLFFSFLPLLVAIAFGVALWKPTHPPWAVIHCLGCGKVMRRGTELVMEELGATEVACLDCTPNPGHYYFVAPREEAGKAG